MRFATIMITLLAGTMLLGAVPAAADTNPAATGGADTYVAQPIVQPVPAQDSDTKADPHVFTYVQFTKEQTINLWAAHLNQPLADWDYSAPTDVACGGPMAVTGGMYCSKNSTIHLNEGALLWRNASRVGFVYLLGHEYGHQLQYLAQGNSWSVAKEQQANCAHPEYRITDAEVQELMSYMLGTVQDLDVHGDAQGLHDAFAIGYRSGSLAACVPIAGPIAGA